MKKNLFVILKASQEYIRSVGKFSSEYAKELNSFFESVSDLYLPLLAMLSRQAEKSPVPQVRLGLVLPPILCSMLSDGHIQELYLDWLDKRIALGEKERLRCKGNEKKIRLIEAAIKKYSDDKLDFSVKYQRKLLPAFAALQKKGFVELLATCGTDVFVPHYADLPEVLSAQIETGLISYRTYFDDNPDGFWLPDLGYMPGVEKLIRAYGLSYTVLDAKSILLGGTLPSSGIFYPVRTENSLVLFAHDPELYDTLCGDDGIIRSPVYRNENRDIGFELTPGELQPVLAENESRFSTGYKYWSNARSRDSEAVYDATAAAQAAARDADSFLRKKSELLTRAAQLLPGNDYVVSVCAFDASALQQGWHEFLAWLEAVLAGAADYDLRLVTGNRMCEKPFTLEKISPYYSAFSGGGYGENLLSSKNCWMMRYVRKSSERMIDLADRFPNDTGLKNRLLNIGAKELMLAQSVGLAKMIDENNFPEFAYERFRQSIGAFTAVFDSLGSNTVSTEWLTTLEEKDSFFPWMNYRIFSKKR